MILFLLISVSFFPFISFLLGKSPFALKVVISYILGLIISTYLSFILYLLKVPFEPFYLLLFLTFLFSLSYFFFKKNIVLPNLKDMQKSFQKIKSFHVLEKVIIGIILLQFIFHTAYGLYWPVRDWDALTLYDFRAKVITQTANLEFLEKNDSNYYLAYPLFTSLVHSFTYSLDITSPMLFYSLLFMSFSLCFYYLLRKKLDRKLALSFTLILITSKVLFEHSIMAYTNLPYAIFLSLAFFFFSEWIERKDLKKLFISVLFLSGSIWTRNAEPFWVVIPPITLLLSTKKDIKKNLLCLLLLGVFMIPWELYKNKILSTQTYPSTTIPLIEGIKNINLLYISQLFWYIWSYFFQPYLLIHSIFFLSFFNQILKRKDREKFIMGIAIISLYLLILAGTIYLSLIYPKWIKVGGSLERMSLFLIPIILFFVGKYDYQKNKK